MCKAKSIWNEMYCKLYVEAMLKVNRRRGARGQASLLELQNSLEDIRLVSCRNAIHCLLVSFVMLSIVAFSHFWTSNTMTCFNKEYTLHAVHEAV